jgi:Cytochrome P460
MSLLTTLDHGDMPMKKSNGMLAIAMITGMLACAKPDQSPEAAKYAVKVPNGLAFSEFKGYEDWHLISISHDGPAMAAILGNPEMIKAYESGIPGNGKPFPDGVKMAKVHWVPTKMATFPSAIVPGRQHDVDFMVKDSKRFQDSGGWGWGAFELDSASGKFTPATTKDTPPQSNDAKCGFACHTIVQKRDFVFTDYARR